MQINKEDFCLEIETIYAENMKISDDTTILETLIDICGKYDIDYPFIKPLLNKSIIEKLEVEALSMNMLKHKHSTSSLNGFL